MNAHQIVANLLEEAISPEYDDPMVRDYLARFDKIERERLKAQERETGLETEREMAEEEKIKREREARKGEASFSADVKKAEAYFHDPERKKWSKMPEVRVGKVTGGDFPAKPPSNVIKGATKWVPKHHYKPKSWEIW